MGDKTQRITTKDIILLSEQPESLTYLLYSIGKEYKFEGYRIFDTVLKVGLSPFRIVRVKYNKGEMDESDVTYLDVSKELEDSLNRRVLNEGLDLTKSLSKGDITYMGYIEDEINEPKIPQQPKTEDELVEPFIPKN